jgi:hypothetical protein
MDQSEAQVAIDALFRRLEEVQQITSELSATGDTTVARNRFDRWKDRASATILREVSQREAERFDQTYVPLTMGGGEGAWLSDALVNHAVAVTSLIEELKKHPDEIEKDVGGEERVTGHVPAPLESPRHSGGICLRPANGVGNSRPGC